MDKKYILMDEVIHHKKLANGLNVYIHPKPKFIQTFASLYVNFGGRDFTYRIEEEDFTLPKGTAHFLEHMLFENNDELLSGVFLDNNADLNAFTSRRLTSYYFSTKNNFSLLLDKLLDNFIDFNFSEKTIKKEAKIISQELSMNDDSDSTKAYKSLVRLMYKDSSIYEDIGGTKTSIKEINQEVLSQAVNHFYHPENMMLLVSGNVKPEEVITQLESHNFMKKEWPAFKSIKRMTDLSDKTIHRKKKFDKKLETNLVEVGIKVPESLFIDNPQKHYMLIDPFLEMMFNPASKLYKVLKKKNLYNHSLTVSPVYDGDYSFINISMETKKSKSFIKTILELIQELPTITFSEKYFLAYLRAEIGRSIKSFDDVKDSHSLIESLLIMEIDIANYFSLKREITLEDFRPYQEIFKKENIYIVEYLKRP